MLLLNIEYVPGKEIEALGLVKGTVVQSKNFGKDFMAGMKTLVGGEITGYTEMLIEARQIATKRMVDEAEALGADAVINVRYGSASVMQGAAEVIAYGTAVRYTTRSLLSEAGGNRTSGRAAITPPGPLLSFPPLTDSPEPDKMIWYPSACTIGRIPIYPRSSVV